MQITARVRISVHPMKPEIVSRQGGWHCLMNLPSGARTSPIIRLFDSMVAMIRGQAVAYTFVICHGLTPFFAPAASLGFLDFLGKPSTGRRLVAVRSKAICPIASGGGRTLDIPGHMAISTICCITPSQIVHLSLCTLHKDREPYAACRELPLNPYRITTWVH